MLSSNTLLNVALSSLHWSVAFRAKIKFDNFILCELLYAKHISRVIKKDADNLIRNFFFFDIFKYVCDF